LATLGERLASAGTRGIVTARQAGSVSRLIAAGGEIARFQGPARPHLHRQADIALEIDRYDFAIRVDLEENRPVAHLERPF
jgi:2-phosphosulfolactate phosphatase